jgi:hypothetical protein
MSKMSIAQTVEITHFTEALLVGWWSFGGIKTTNHQDTHLLAGQGIKRYHLGD